MNIETALLSYRRPGWGLNLGGNLSHPLTTTSPCFFHPAAFVLAARPGRASASSAAHPIRRSHNSLKRVRARGSHQDRRRCSWVDSRRSYPSRLSAASSPKSGSAARLSSPFNFNAPAFAITFRPPRVQGSASIAPPGDRGSSLRQGRWPVRFPPPRCQRRTRRLLRPRPPNRPPRSARLTPPSKSTTPSVPASSPGSTPPGPSASSRSPASREPNVRLS